MTCEKCGKEIPEGQRFCGFCGASAEVKTIALSPEKRRMAVERLHHAHDICVQAYERIQKGNELCSEAEERLAPLKTRFYRLLFLTLGIILLVPILVFGFRPILIALNAGIFALYAIIPFTLIYILFIFLPRRKGTALQKEGESVHQEGVNILSDNAEILSILPFEYCYPLATEYIARLFETDRVDTMREALKMFDEQKYRWAMEEGQKQILKNQQMQYEMLCSIQGDVKFLVWSDLLD
ncbi:MAG: zinc ribbon domain-containing protein [Clostridia bacterium]|nr:zinc ribbon domain-containing protein [Clostridia bacterium]